MTRGCSCYRWGEHAEARPLRLDNALVFHSVAATNCLQNYNKIRNAAIKPMKYFSLMHFFGHTDSTDSTDFWPRPVDLHRNFYRSLIVPLSKLYPPLVLLYPSFSPPLPLL